MPNDLDELQCSYYVLCNRDGKMTITLLGIFS
jgi:hypothetical protein